MKKLIGREGFVPLDLSADFDYIESSETPLAERAIMTRMLYNELFVNKTKKPIIIDSLPERNNKLGFRHFFLPGNHGESFDGNEDPKTTREGFDERHKIHEVSKRNFITVDQGGLWISPKSSNPYFFASMSECSLVVAKSTDKLVVSHIAFSEIEQIKATIELIKQIGLRVEDAIVIASIGEYYKRLQKSYYSEPRATNLNDFTTLGFSIKNIKPFEYKGQIPTKHRGLPQTELSICKNLVTRDFVFSYTGNYVSNPQDPYENSKLLNDEYLTEDIYPI